MHTGTIKNTKSNISHIIRLTVTGICVAALFCSCGHALENDQGDAVKAALEVRDYVKWAGEEKRGLEAVKKIGDIKYTLLHRPWELMALQELAPDSVNEQSVAAIVNEINGLQYYSLKMEAPDFHDELLKLGIQSMQEYEQRIKYFSFAFQNDIQLVDGQDTLSCVLFHFERIYGLSPRATFMLGFPLDNPESINKNDKTLVFEDSVFGNGTVKLRLSSKDLNKIPKIKYKS